eukprot:9489153-Pyramimonas_sp.AAC.1
MNLIVLDVLLEDPLEQFGTRQGPPGPSSAQIGPFSFVWLGDLANHTTRPGQPRTRDIMSHAPQHRAKGLSPQLAVYNDRYVPSASPACETTPKTGSC